MLSTALPFPGALTAASRDFVHLHVSQSHDLGEIATRSLHIELFLLRPALRQTSQSVLLFFLSMICFLHVQDSHRDKENTKHL